ncbi:extracellular solute-binding protein [Paenibacillus contaminans]|uniref:ABC transporter substrate-binding protein n=1 Tax=Paenibacillus contaminans TaxID=450362 RepID=A0A329MB13_9BACL|nr:extracellular solute-binding protein [Paenibacillus contaminans]RAV17315.1 ABC transporter substrate-binding protein [Paenibacillus contaminans]
MNRRRSSVFLATALAGIMVVVTACSEKQEKPVSEQSPGNQTGTEKQESAATKPSPLGKYDSKIEVTAARDLSGVTFRPGESIENNIWSKAYEEELGIKVKYAWTTLGDYDQKLNVSIASGELPDIFPVNATQLKQLVDSGQLEDMTDLFEAYASDLTKKIVKEDPNQLKSATFKGKLMAIPKAGSATDFSQVLWIRKDWLDRLQLPEPKTLDDVVKIAEAFVNRDPDGNGKADTYGLAVGSGMNGTYTSLRGFFNGYHAYPNSWYKDKSGKFVYGGVQPETRNALAKLSEMYKAGLIDKEFAIKGDDKLVEQMAGGKVGINYGPWWIPGGPLQTNKNQNPDADWKAYGIPSADDKPAKLQVDFPVAQYVVVKKGAKNPEAAIKMLNLMVKYAYELREIEKYFVPTDGISLNAYPLLFASPVNGNLTIHVNIMKALETKDPAKLNAEEKSYYDRIIGYRNGDNKLWFQEATYGGISAWSGVKEKVDQGLLQAPDFFGAVTKTMSQKGGVLTKLELETFTKIIMNEAPIEEFDKFVENWHKLGGDDIAKEVEAWASNL